MNLRNLTTEKYYISATSREELTKYFEENFKVLTKNQGEVSSVHLDIHSDRLLVQSGFALFPTEKNELKDAFIINNAIMITEYPEVSCKVSVAYEKGKRPEHIFPAMEHIMAKPIG